MFGLRKLLFEAGLVDCPPVQRRQGGPLTRQARLAVDRRTRDPRTRSLAYLDARAAVLRPKTIDKLTSALGVFGEFLTDEFPELASIDKLERRHIEAFLAWTATRTCRGNHGGSARRARSSPPTRRSACAGSSTTSPPGDGPKRRPDS